MARRIAGTTEEDWLYAEQLKEMIKCRTYGHPWDEETAGDSPLARANDRSPVYLYCDRCKTHRKVVTNRYFKRTNRYDYDDKYKRIGHGPVTAAVNSVFWTVLQRSLGGGR